MRKLKSLFVVLALIFVFGIHNNLHAQDEAVISVTYYLDGSKVKSEDHPNYAVGYSFTIGERPSQVGENSKFLFWTINDAIRRDLPESFGARVKSTTHLKAYFISSDKKAAAFVDSNLKLLEIQYLEASAPPVLPENDPDKALSAFDGWGLIGSYETKVETPTIPQGSRLSDVYVARYLIESKDININVDGEVNSYGANGEVKLTSDKTNVVWRDEKGTIIGYGSPYVFTAIGDMIITSHEGESIQEYVTISSPHQIRQGHTSFVGKHNLPESYDIIEYGFKYYDTKSNQDVKAVSNIINGETNEFLMSFSDISDKNNIQAYVVYAENNDDIKTLESDYRVHEDTGSFTTTEVPNWVKGYETNVKDSFVKAYKESGFKNKPSPLEALELPKARVVLYQDIDGEGTIFLNEREGKPLVVTDLLAVSELKDLMFGSNWGEYEKGILIDIVEKNGETYYVTDRRGHNGIFKVTNEQYSYMDTRIGVGDGTYADVMWGEYTKAYKLSTQFMQSLGLPIGSVESYTYTTKDLDETGRYLSGETTSLKTYTKQPFDNGWLIQARMQVRKADGTLGGHQLIQHAAAPILTDMYNHVIDIEDNDKLNVTGAPVSLEFNVNGVRYQNFEYGYVKLSDNDTVTFIPDLVVDSKGTEMDRRVGASLTWDNIRIDSRPEETTYEKASNHFKYMITWERLRVAQNFRETVGEMIRDTNRPEVDRTFTTSLNRVVSRAPEVGVWMTFASGEGSSLGGTKTFIYHKYWYDTAYELAPSFNTAIIVDDGPHIVDGVEFRLGRPSSKFITHEGRHFQLFENGLAFINNQNKIEYRYGLDKAAFFINYYQYIKEKFAEVGVTFP